MTTLQLTDEMVHKLQHFYNLPETYEDEEYDEAMDIVLNISNQLFGRK